MAKVLYNPTDEEMDVWYAGVNVIIHGEQQTQEDIGYEDREETIPIEKVFKVKVGDKAANHAINHFGPRGLIELDYSDGKDEAKEKEKVTAALKRNLEFKKKQVMRFNLNQSQKKQKGLAYTEATPQIKKYAKQLGIKIEEPYAVGGTTEKELADKMTENVELKNTIQDLMKQMTSQQEQINKLLNKEEATGYKWEKITKNNLKKWVNNPKNKVGAMPEEEKAALGERYKEFYGEPLP